MRRFFYFLMRVGLWAIFLGAGYYMLERSPGSLDINWMQTHIKVTLANAYVLLIITLFMLYGFGYVIKSLLEIPMRIHGYFTCLKQSGDKSTFWRALLAVSQGNYKDLELYGQVFLKNQSFKEWAPFFQIESLLHDLSGENILKAQKLCEDLLTHEPAKDYALSGLMQCAKSQGDDQRLVFLGEKLSKEALVPKLVIDMLQSYGRLGQGPKVFKYLNLLEKSGVVLDLGVLLEIAQNLNATGHNVQGLDLLEKGFQKAAADDSCLIPFVIYYANTLNEVGGPKKACALIEQAWAMQPDGDLWQLYVDLKNCQNPNDVFKATQRLASFANDHLDSRYYVVKAAIAANLLGFASQELQDIRRLGGGTTQLWQELDTSMIEKEKLLSYEALSL